MALDGKLLTFDQGGNLVTTLSIPPTAGSNAGTAGISFGAEDNRGQIGGQRADDLVVASFSSLAGLPVQDNLTPATLTVNSTGDASDSSTGDGLCDTGALVGGQPECTLRGAIEEANALSGANTIEFDIPGAGPHTIQPASALPTVTDPVVIDGYTQPGASPNTNGPGLGLNTVLMIELDGTSAGTSFVPWLDITGGSSIVRELVINRFSGSGIRLQTSGNVVDWNFIGTDVAGTVATPNSNPGVSIIAAGNIIGGTGSGARNVISGNESNGVGIVGGMSTGNQILGNFIWTDVSGAAALGNRFPAVSIFNAADNTIGGTSPGAGNVVSGNDSEGILINGVGAVGNLVQGNSIGTDVTGTASLGNVFQGVDIRDNASDNTIGGTAEGAGNTIAFNGGIGVLAVSGTGNGILGNSIFSNTQLGIDLELDGVTPNDVGDGDTGANNLQNFHVLTAAVSGSTAIQGTLNSTPDTTFRLEFFSNSACDASGHGEGETFLGSTDVTTNGSGDASFTAGFPATVSVGHFITSTATDPGNNTSEFSQCVVVNASPLAFDQTVATTPDTPAAITLSGLDASTSASLSTIIVSLPCSGDLSEGITDIITTPHTLTGDTVTYTPDPGFSGDDSFTFLVNNGAGDSNVATVTVNATSGQHVVQGQVRLERRTDHVRRQGNFLRPGPGLH